MAFAEISCIRDRKSPRLSVTMLVEDDAEGAEEIAGGGSGTECVGAVAVDVD